MRVALLMAAAPGTEQMKEPVDYVNLNMGGIGQMLTSAIPRVTLPFGAMVIAPMTTPGITDRFTADKVFGFPTGGVTLMPMSGPPQTVPNQYASHFDHDLETATPYYYKALLEDYDIETEFTISAHAAYYRLTFPGGKAAHVLFSGPMGGAIEMAGGASDERTRRRRQGWRRGGGGRGSYFLRRVLESLLLRLRRLPVCRLRADDERSRRPQAGARKRIRHRHCGGSLRRARTDKLESASAFPSFSLDQARQNLQSEIPRWYLLDKGASVGT